MSAGFVLTSVWLPLSTINSHTSGCQVHEEEGGSPNWSSVAVLTPAMRGWVCTIFAFHFDLLVSFHIANLKTRNFLG